MSKCLDLDRVEYVVEHDGDTNCNWCTWNDLQRSEKETEKNEIKGGIDTTAQKI